MLQMVMKITAIVALASIGATPIIAADADNGKMLSRKCSACHGKDGMARDPEVPNLAGQSAFYVEKSLKDYQSGIREDRRMSLLVKTLDDNDIKDLAAWYASIKVTVELPE